MQQLKFHGVDGAGEVAVRVLIWHRKVAGQDGYRFHDFLTLVTSTEKLLTPAGFELALIGGTPDGGSTSWAMFLI